MRKPSSLPCSPLLRPLLAIPLALALGCADPDFNRPELLELPRILAMQAEPPQPSYGNATTLRALIYQPDDRPHADECVGAVDPGPKYEWSWCPLPTSSSDGFKCPVDQVQLNVLFAALGLGAAPSLHLGNGETATLTNPFPASLLYGFCTGDIPIDPRMFGLENIPTMGDAGVGWAFSCDMPSLDDPDREHPLGFPVTVRLTYTPPCGSPHQEKYGDTLTAVFTVHLPTDDALPPNQNPVVGDIFAVDYVEVVPVPDAGAPVDGAQPVLVDAGAIDSGESVDGGESLDGAGGFMPDGGFVAADVALPPPPDGGVPLAPAVLPRQKRVRLWIDMAKESAEPLPRPGLLDQVKEGKVFRFERLALLWYAEAGDFGGEHGSFGRETGFQPTLNSSQSTPEDDLTMERARQVVWALPYKEDYDPDQARVVVVIRDSRGGVAWTQAVATLEPTP